MQTPTSTVSSGLELALLADQTMQEVEREKILDTALEDFKLFEDTAILGWKEITENNKVFTNTAIASRPELRRHPKALEAQKLNQGWLYEFEPKFYPLFYKQFSVGELPRMQTALQTLLADFSLQVIDNKRDKERYKKEISKWENFRQIIYKQFFSQKVKDIFGQ